MDVRIEDEQFEDWVLEAIDALPQAFRERLGSVAIIVAEWPTEEQLRSVGANGLYGLYSGDALLALVEESGGLARPRLVWTPAG